MMSSLMHMCLKVWPYILEYDFSLCNHTMQPAGSEDTGDCKLVSKDIGVIIK